MTNLSSRKVKDGKHKRIIMYLYGDADEIAVQKEIMSQYVNLHSFFLTIVDATTKWIESYNNEREKIVDFVKRYDLTISDARFMRADLS